MNIKGCLLHTHDDWKTPKKLYDFLMDNGWIDCFPYQSQFNEFENEYYGVKLFINPPFSKMKEVTKWIIEQSRVNKILLLIPARTDTKYFHELIEKCHPFIFFVKGRLHYNESKEGAPFPTICLLFDYWSTRYAHGDLDDLIEFIRKEETKDYE